jgi:ribosomal protein L3
VHGNHKRLSSNTLSQAATEEDKTFPTNYVEENAILLLGSIPGFKNDAIKLLFM